LFVYFFLSLFPAFPFFLFSGLRLNLWRNASFHFRIITSSTYQQFYGQRLVLLFPGADHFDMIWYGTILYYMICDMIWYDTIRYDMMWYDMIWYDICCIC
jgi:hypothetical protein